MPNVVRKALLLAFIASGFVEAAETARQIAVTIRVIHEERVLAVDDELAHEGSYHELVIGGLEIRYRVASTSSDMARIDVEAFREGNLVAKPSLIVGVEDSATVGFRVSAEEHDGSSELYELEFRLDDRQPNPPRPLLPAGGEPAPVPR